MIPCQCHPDFVDGMVYHFLQTKCISYSKDSFDSCQRGLRKDGKGLGCLLLWTGKVKFAPKNVGTKKYPVLILKFHFQVE